MCFQFDLQIGLRSFRRIFSLCSVNADEFAFPAFIFEFNEAFDEGEQRVVLTTSDVFARFPFRSTLACKNIAAEHVLASKFLQPEPLRV